MLLGRSNDGFIYLFTEPVRVLAVDDDPIMREFAVAQLSHPGGEIVTAFDGQDALEKLREDEKGFDLVISDLEMPRMTGFNLCEAIRADPRFADLPVVVITGRDDIFAIDRAYEVGATSFVAKPVNWRLLGYQLRYVLRACRAERGAATPPPVDAFAVAGPGRESAPDLLPALAREAACHLAAIESAARTLDPHAAPHLLGSVGDLMKLFHRAAAIADIGPEAISGAREEISLAGLLNERARIAERAAAHRMIKVEFDRPPPVWRIEGDRRLLTQALDLLLGSLTAAADDSATLNITVTPVSGLDEGRDGFEIAICAEGRAPVEDLDAALVRRIVEVHDGELTIRRANLVETQARLLLPAARPTRQPAPGATMAGFA